jgi:hypothetical protein
MSAIEELRKHAEEMTAVTGVPVELREEGTHIFVLLSKVRIPGKPFRVDVSDVLFIADQMYPLSAMDMFWTEHDVIRSDGSIPQGAEGIENYVGRPWRRFSWHRNGIWNPTGNPLLDHYAFMECRLTAEAQR